MTAEENLIKAISDMAKLDALQAELRVYGVIEQMLLEDTGLGKFAVISDAVDRVKQSVDKIGR